MSDIRVNWFEIPVTDLDRATAFYAAVLDRELGEIEGPDGPMKVFLGPEGPSGALTRTDSTPAVAGVVVYLHCMDIDAALARAESNGGQMLQARSSIGPFGFVGKFRDSEGNAVALHTPPQS